MSNLISMHASTSTRQVILSCEWYRPALTIRMHKIENYFFLFLNQNTCKDKNKIRWIRNINSFTLKNCVYLNLHVWWMLYYLPIFSRYCGAILLSINTDKSCWWKTELIMIIWLLMKSAGLGLHCFQKKVIFKKKKMLSPQCAFCVKYCISQIYTLNSYYPKVRSTIVFTLTYQ